MQAAGFHGNAVAVAVSHADRPSLETIRLSPSASTTNELTYVSTPNRRNSTPSAARSATRNRRSGSSTSPNAPLTYSVAPSGDTRTMPTRPSSAGLNASTVPEATSTAARPERGEPFSAVNVPDT